MLRDSALRMSFRQAGAIMGAPSDSLRIGVGMRAIVFLWVPLAPGTPTPTELRHRLAFAIADASSGTTVDTPSGSASVIDSLTTPVSHEPVPVLRPPFRGGQWLAGDGPSDSSNHRRAITPLNGKAFLSQRFATDWVMIGPNGNTWHDDRDRAENYWGFGQPVVAVADGEVTEVVDSIADNVPHAPLPPVTVSNIAGNYVIVRIGPSRYFMVAHLKRGSVRVRARQRVARGDLLGLLGSSGQATAPHLHFQVMDRSSPLAAEGVPYVFDRFTWLGLGRDFEPNQERPRIVKRRELPEDDAVVDFQR